MNNEAINERIQIYFKEGYGLRTINASINDVDSVIIKDDFLKVHDTVEHTYHCYNLDIISHIHYPDNWRNLNDQIKHRSSD